MARLTSRNLQNLQDCIREIYSDLDAESLPNHVLQATSRLIPSGVTSFASISRLDQQIGYTGQASQRKWEGLNAFVRHMDEHPILSYLHPELLKPHPYKETIENGLEKRFPFLRQAQHYRAAKISDALTDRHFRNLGLYNDFFRKNDVAYQLLISFLPAAGSYSMISFNRDKRDFTEEERLILNLLAPHIAQAFKNAEVHATARQAVASQEFSKKPLKDYGLTSREEDVLSWVAQGKTNAETARILNIAPGTIKIHLEKIFQKLGVENRTAAARHAMGIARHHTKKK